MKFLLASRNEGKLAEFRQLLPGFELLAWPRNAPGIPEDGAFFRDNAAQKADFARAWWGGTARRTWTACWRTIRVSAWSRSTAAPAC